MPLMQPVMLPAIWQTMPLIWLTTQSTPLVIWLMMHQTLPKMPWAMRLMRLMVLCKQFVCGFIAAKKEGPPLVGFFLLGENSCLSAASF
jgi:predicted Kef-type K+ transport protein